MRPAHCFWGPAPARGRGGFAPVAFGDSPFGYLGKEEGDLCFAPRGAMGARMSIVDIVIEEERWAAYGLEAQAERAAGAVLTHLALEPGLFRVVVLGCDDARIAELNTEFRDKPAPTNVLSWPTEERGSRFAGEAPDLPAPGTAEEPAELGDIAIAWETCAREAAEQDKPMADHVLHLLVHGVLHLLGYDHIDDDDAELMEETERQILAQLGIADPY